MSEKVNKIVTEKIVELLESGTVPWQKPWSTSRGGRPQNFITKRPYRGINALITSPLVSGFDCSYWLTAKQLNKMGFKLSEGERYTPIVFWGHGEKVEGGEKKRFGFTRFYKIFNRNQIENHETIWPKEKEESVPPEDWDKNAMDIVARYEEDGGPVTKHGYNGASYSPTLDIIKMPSPERFSLRGEYWSTRFHEAVHSTGHTTRLNRKEGMKSLFGDHAYSEEELVAEMGNCFLLADIGVPEETLDKCFNNSAGYIEHWLGKLKSDRKFLMQAAQRAEKACDCIRGTTYEKQA